MTDKRLLPRIRTGVLVKAGLVMFWARLGSLNSLAQTSEAVFWLRWLGRSLPSADTTGRVFAQVDSAGLRISLARVYSCLKRNKALPSINGFDLAVIDGHETHNSYRRHCPGCLQRTLDVGGKKRIQYYHRNVTIMLLSEPLRLFLDMEPQRPGEDEVTTALRLLKRVLSQYPRAFQILLADALYAQARFVNFLLDHRKHIIAVLKDDRRDIYQDACGLFSRRAAIKGSFRSRDCLWWDEENLTTWSQVKEPMRVIRSRERWVVRRQISGQLEQLSSEWVWVTTLPQSLVSVALVVKFGHLRWDIENLGFNQLVNEWRADHLYRHDPLAIEAFTLLAFLAHNMFFAFLWRNLKLHRRYGKTFRYWARVCSAELHLLNKANPNSRSP